MIVNADEVVYLALTILFLDDSCRKIKGLNGEVDHDVQLLSTPARVAETLEMHHEDIRRLPQGQLLAGLPVLLTARAVPHVLLGKDLGSLELVQALFERKALRTARLTPPLAQLKTRIG